MIAVHDVVPVLPAHYDCIKWLGLSKKGEPAYLTLELP